ncbi:MAG: hypothetical protein NTW87_30915 [Planctomycetota bacterium]|nr:hypothetical protein [Planctomycetota bacterium]
MGQQEYQKFTDLEKDKSPKAKEQFEKAYDEYQDAVDYYRRAIAEARSDRTDLPTRVEVESKSWFEMGLAYLKMRHYYESIITYQAMRGAFLPENRKKWLGDLTVPTKVKPVVAKQVEALLADLDKPKEGLLYKSGQNIAFALDRNQETHRNPKDLWNQRLKSTIRGSDPGTVADGEVTDNDYLAAKADMEEAKQLSAAGTEALKEDPKLAEESYTSAAKKYASAGDKFLKVKPSSPAYEIALYQSGTSFTMAQALWVTGKARAKPPADTAAQCKELGLKALAAFDKYDDFIAKAPVTKDEDKKRRQGLAGMVLLARNALYSGAEEWRNVVKSSDQYLNWEEQVPQEKSSADVAYLNKFRALIELGATNLAPDCDEDLIQAEKTMRQWRKLREKDNKVFVFMLNAVSRRYNLAAFQVEDFMKKGKKEAKTKDGKTVELTTDMVEVYERKVAELQRERVKMVEEAEGEAPPTLEDYSRLVYLFTKTRMDREAADTARKLLERFDSDNKSCIIPPDDEKTWQAMLTKMQAIIRYNDLNKWDRCKKDHMTLVDYMYDTRQGLAQEKQEQRPEFDRFNADMDNARKQLESIRKNYPDCQTWDPKLGEGGKSYLGRIEEEIDFRRKIEATRDLLFNKALLVAKKLDEDKQPEEAKRYREVANAQLEVLRKIRMDTPDMQIKQATISISIGEYAKALETLNNVKLDAPEDSPLFFDASRMQSETYALQKKWKEAAEYPEFTALVAGFDAPLVKNRWPEMKEFLRECYASGAPCPEALKKLLKPKEDGAKTEEPKKEEGKTEPPKKEEPKADEKKNP